MVDLATADDPGLVCLQEIPVWALGRLEGWSGMDAFTAIAARPLLLSATLGRALTAINHGLLRSAFTGQGNAILVANSHPVRGDWTRQVSRPKEGERRVCQAVQLEGLGLVANFHVTTAFADDQFMRVVQAVEELAAEHSPVILCGDANLRPGEGRTYAELGRLGYSRPAPGIDQILVRGLQLESPPRQRDHTLDGLVVSDHAPLEAVIR